MELLISEANKIGVEITQNAADKFFRYMQFLIEYNKKINLTAITSPEDIIMKHFIDSLSILQYHKLNAGDVIDIGSGAGFPGVPIKIINTNINLTLLDSLSKRVTFLKELCHELKLDNVTCVHSRAEDFKTGREKYDVCLSRAVAKLNVLAELCLPFVKVGGMFIAHKGFDISQELLDAQRAIKKLGGEVVCVEECSFHSIVFIRKLFQTSPAYPRNSSQVTKNPL